MFHFTITDILSKINSEHLPDQHYYLLMGPSMYMKKKLCPLLGRFNSTAVYMK